MWVVKKRKWKGEEVVGMEDRDIIYIMFEEAKRRVMEGDCGGQGRNIGGGRVQGVRRE